MSVEDDFRAIVGRLRSWGFDIVEYSGCYGRDNGTGWTHGKPVGHNNHHFVCAMNPEQHYIDSLVANLAAGNTVNWFADVNGRGYLIGTGPMNHAGTGNSYVLDRVMADQPNYSVASGPGSMSGNQTLSGTECQHPGDETPWPASMLDIMVAINAAEFLQWGYSAYRAINHYAWTNRKIDMSWLGGVASDTNGRQLVADVAARMAGAPPTNGDDMPLNDDDLTRIKNIVSEQLMWALPRALASLLDGKPNAAMPDGASSVVLDGMGVHGWLDRGVNASRTGKPNAAYPNPGTPKD
jgi:hypothetical protein